MSKRKNKNKAVEAPLKSSGFKKIMVLLAIVVTLWVFDNHRNGQLDKVEIQFQQNVSELTQAMAAQQRLNYELSICADQLIEGQRKIAIIANEILDADYGEGTKNPEAWKSAFKKVLEHCNEAANQHKSIREKIKKSQKMLEGAYQRSKDKAYPDGHAEDEHDLIKKPTTK